MMSGILKLSCREDLENYCEDNGILIEDFNQPVQLTEYVNCSEIFSGCIKFNQEVTIPYSVTECDSMFQMCLNFNRLSIVRAAVLSSICILG